MNDAVKHNKPESLNNSYMAPEIANQRIQTLAALQVSAGEHILDVGCGTGFLTHDLALQAGSAGHIVAMDLQAEMIEATLQRCGHFDQVSAQTGNVKSLDFADSQFDAVTCTQVLLYVDDVQQALSEMYRVLKPGGRIAVLETDWQGVVLRSNFPETTDKIMNAWDQSVSSPNLPRTLMADLSKQGFTAITAKAIPLLNTSYSEHSFSVSSIDWLGKVACKHGSISKQESLEWKADLLALGEKNAYFFCVNRFLFTAVKR